MNDLELVVVWSGERHVYLDPALNAPPPPPAPLRREWPIEVTSRPHTLRKAYGTGREAIRAALSDDWQILSDLMVAAGLDVADRQASTNAAACLSTLWCLGKVERRVQVVRYAGRRRQLEYRKVQTAIRSQESA